MTQDLGALSGSKASPEADKSSSPIGYDPARLKRGDRKLLAKILATNGGGIETVYSWGDRKIPAAQERRLLGLGLIRRKPNDWPMVIHTNLTAAALTETPNE